MLKNIAKRFLLLIPVLFAVSLLSFFIIYAAPGDPVQNYMNPNMTNEEVEALRESLGLNGSFWDQYTGWLNNTLNGNLGNSIASKRPVTTQIMEKLPNTILLMGVSLFISIVISIPLGLISGQNKNLFLDNLISFISFLGISVPSFWGGMVCIIIFSSILGIFPSGGMYTIGQEKNFADLVKHMILPVMVSSIAEIGMFTRYIRSNTIEQLGEDYVDTAISKGLKSKQVLFRHVLKNCLLPMITIIGLRLTTIVSGSFVIESVFAWPGMGTLAMTAIRNLDYPLIMGTTLLSCIILIIGNTIADILYTVVDPRIRQ